MTGTNAAPGPSAVRQTGDPAVKMSGITKSFDGVPVLNGVDFEVAAGEVHALAGGNGAGKSTLMKILQGVYTPDAGEIRLGGQRVRHHSITEAQRAGIGMVFQEFSLIPTLSVARNVFLDNEPRSRLGLINDRATVSQARTVFAQIGIGLDPRLPVGGLGTAYWQLTEIAKALSRDARVLIMDEPTASLARSETDTLFALIHRLRSNGIAIIYISHRLQEIERIADRITILRDGRRLLTRPTSQITADEIIEGIAGKRVEGMAYRGPQCRNRDSAETPTTAQPHPVRPADPTDSTGSTRAAVLDVAGLRAEPRTHNVSFQLRAGEIVGLAGLMGSGRTELAETLFGIRRKTGGSIRIRGRDVAIGGPADAIAHGITLIPEDRREQGLVLDHSVRDNLLLPLLNRIRRGPFVSGRRGRSLAADLLKRFSVKTANPGRPVRLLSGGNQQKVVLAKWLGTEPDILILDEPTAGVDIATKTDILETIRALAAAGKAVLVISSEYPELLAISDRILVLHDGHITADLPRDEIENEEALHLAVQGVSRA